MTDRDADFTAYLQARQGRLLRTAYLLTGDQHQAEDLLQTSLAKLYLAWDKVRDRDNAERWARGLVAQGDARLEDYKTRKNTSSVDGLPAWPGPLAPPA